MHCSTLEKNKHDVLADVFYMKASEKQMLLKYIFPFEEQNLLMFFINAIQRLYNFSKSMGLV